VKAVIADATWTSPVGVGKSTNVKPSYRKRVSKSVGTETQAWLSSNPPGDEHLKRTALGDFQNGLVDVLVVEPASDDSR